LKIAEIEKEMARTQKKQSNRITLRTFKS